MIPDRLEKATYPNDFPKEEILRSIQAIEDALRAIRAELGVEPDAGRESLRRVALEARLEEREAERRADDAAARSRRNEELLTTPLPSLEEMHAAKRARGIEVPETEAETMARLRARAAALKEKQ